MIGVAQPVAEFSRRYRFSASHRLHIARLGAEKNREIFGKCNNPHGHGHNYTVQVTLRGPVDPITGMVVDLEALDPYVRAQVLERFDFANLNADPAFAHCVPSTEHLAIELWRVLASFAGVHSPVQLRRVRVEETGNNAFDYFGPASAGHPDFISPERRHAALCM